MSGEISPTWSRPVYAAQEIFSLADEIYTEANLTPSQVSPRPIDIVRFEKLHFIDTIQSARLKDALKQMPYYGHLRAVPNVDFSKPSVNYHYRRTPIISFSLMTYHGYENGNDLVAGDALHIFDDPSRPYDATTSLTRINHGTRMVPLSISGRRPSQLQSVYERLLAVRESDVNQERERTKQSLVRRTLHATLQAIAFGHGD